jgi:hypothetical protein
MEHYKRIIKGILLLVTIVFLIYIYKNNNPENNEFFPKCPFKTTTGYKCPGCGSQRAIHHLLNFDIYGALNENLLLVISIPYIIFGFIFDLINKPSKKLLVWRNRLYGTKAIYTILFLIISFWILRNIPYCQQCLIF